MTGHNKGVPSIPTHTYTKTGKRVDDILAYKHPALKQLSVEAFCQYDVMPVIMDINMMTDIIEKVDKTMQGAAVTYWIDAVSR